MVNGNMERRKINIRDVHANSGQVEGLPANPRQIKDERFRKLVQSVRDLPEMTEARDLLVYPHYCDVIIARWEKLTGKEAVKLND